MGKLKITNHLRLPDLRLPDTYYYYYVGAMFLFVCNRFMGCKLKHKKAFCTLKYLGAAIMKLCKLSPFTGSDFGRLFSGGVNDPKNYLE